MHLPNALGAVYGQFGFICGGLFSLSTHSNIAFKPRPASSLYASHSLAVSKDLSWFHSERVLAVLTLPSGESGAVKRNQPVASNTVAHRFI